MDIQDSRKERERHSSRRKLYPDKQNRMKLLSSPNLFTRSRMVSCFLYSQEHSGRRGEGYTMTSQI